MWKYDHIVNISELDEPRAEAKGREFICRCFVVYPNSFRAKTVVTVSVNMII
jgi:hypothetical protein